MFLTPRLKEQEFSSTRVRQLHLDAAENWERIENGDPVSRMAVPPLWGIRRIARGGFGKGRRSVFGFNPSHTAGF